MKKLLLLVLIILMVFSSTFTTYAADEPITSVNAFTHLPGDAQYINNNDNYYLDLMELGILDTDIKLLNNVVNAIFGLEKWLVHITCNAFYFVTSFDFGEVLATDINSVQSGLKTFLFDPMFTLMFVLSGFWIAVMMAKRNMQEILNQTIKVIFIVVLASVLASKSSTVISMVDDVTNLASNSVMSAVSLNPGGGANYGATTAGNLWVDLIHTPWKSMEFGTGHIDNEASAVSDLLSKAPNTEERDKIVEDLVGDRSNPKVFGKNMPIWRLSLVIAHLLPCTATCVLYLLIALLQLTFRIMTIFLIFVGFLILLLSLVPFFGGLNLLKKWSLKIAEMQIMILSLAFLLGFMTMINSILVTIFGPHGWLLSHVIRIGIDIAIFVFRDKVFGFFATVQKNVQQATQNPHMTAYRMQRALEDVGNVSGSAQNFNKNAPQAIHNTLASIKELSKSIQGWGNYEEWEWDGFEPNLRVNDPITPEMQYDYEPNGNPPPMLNQSANMRKRPLLVSPNQNTEEAPTENKTQAYLPKPGDLVNADIESRPILKGIENTNIEARPVLANSFIGNQSESMPTIDSETTEISAVKHQQDRPTMTGMESTESASKDFNAEGKTTNIELGHNATPKPQKGPEKVAEEKPIVNSNNDFRGQIEPPTVPVSASLELGEGTQREFVNTKQNKRQRPTLEKTQASEASDKKPKDTINEQLDGNTKVGIITPTILMQSTKGE